MIPIGIFSAVAVLAFAFFSWYRPWHLKWGATREELSRSMPGDEIVPRPIFNVPTASFQTSSTWRSATWSRWGLEKAQGSG